MKFGNFAYFGDTFLGNLVEKRIYIPSTGLGPIFLNKALRVDLPLLHTGKEQNFLREILMSNQEQPLWDFFT